MILRRIRIAICVLLPVLLLGARPATSCAAPRAVESPERRLAAAQFKRGKTLYAAGDFDGALAAFQNGFETYPLRGFLVNIAQCHRRLGQLDQAIAAYRQFLEGADIAPALRQEVEEALAEVERVRGAAPVAEQPPSDVAPVPAPAAVAHSSDDEVPPGAQLTPAPQVVVERRVVAKDRKKTRPWVWALVGVGAAAVVAGVTVGVVLGTRPGEPRAGSLGLLDGRTR